MDSVFKETILEVNDPSPIKSLQHAITTIHDHITHIPAKVMICVKIKYTTVNNEQLDVWVSTKFQAVITFADLNEEWAETMLQGFITASEEAKLRGSGWSEGEVLEIKLKQSKYNPIVGNSYVPLPEALINKRAVLNIKNTDNKCFMWCILAKLFPVLKNAERITNYTPYINHLNFEGIEFPVNVECIDQFEDQNKLFMNVDGQTEERQLSVNVYGWSEERQLFPIKISKNAPKINDPLDTHVDLLLFNNHYTLIRTMSRLIAYTTKDSGKQEICRRCLLRIPSVQAAHEHRKHCVSSTECETELITPKENSKVCFKNYNKLQVNPYVVYADFESLIVPYEGPKTEKLPKTAVVNNHQICSYAFIIVRSDGEHSKPELYRGPDASKYFLQCMTKLRNELSNKLNLSEIIMTPEDEEKFRTATTCWICKGELETDRVSTDRVRDHDHITGKFRGAAHNNCNLKLKVDPKTWKLPIFFHNLRGYDGHLILQAVTSDYNAKCIAQSSEKYMTFTLGQLSFFDSAQHLTRSLESLAGSLSKCTITEEYFDSGLVRKGVYPYEYMDSWERFDEDTLPPKGAFFSKLKGEDISDEDYEHAQLAWNKLECKTMGDYHDAYLLADVCLLADVFENYRQTCMKHYSLDASHYISAPGMSWDAFLRTTGVQIHLLTDLPLLQTIEDGLRGGISMSCHNYCKANNKYLPDFDASKPSNYIMYLDANNLYGWAMCQSLPISDFDMIENERQFNVNSAAFSLLNVQIDPDDEWGHIFEVDLEYPDYLHDYHNDYPLAAERLQIGKEPPKLVPNLQNKKHYVCHWRLLQFYLRHGLILKAVHKIIVFRQSKFMKPYIMKNTELRTKATDASEKDFFKLMNNACFGKTMENPHKRKDIRLVTKENQAIKLTSKPQYQDFRKFHDSLYGIMMKKTKVKLDKPVFIGFCVLELSKLLMLEFLYDYFKPRYPDSKVLYTDTDSFILDIPTEDFYEDMRKDRWWYDTSDYPKDSPLHSNRNKKVIGKMKDELNGTLIKEYVGLRSKMYSVSSMTGVTKKAKGISKQSVKKNITHENYKEALLNSKVFYHENTSLQSNLHQINTTVVQKKSLEATNSKRVFSTPEFSYAIGHWRLRDNL